MLVVPNITKAGALGTYSRMQDTHDNSQVYCAWILTVYPDLSSIPIDETQSTDDLVLDIEDGLRAACYKVKNDLLMFLLHPLFSDVALY